MSSYISQKPRKKRRVFLKIIAWTLGIIVALVGSLWVATTLSPWPGVFLIRSYFDSDSSKVNQELAQLTSSSVAVSKDISYDPNDPDALLDVYYPQELVKSARELPVIVWVHGGGWVANNKNQFESYFKILSAEGFTVVGVDYTISPEANYPTPQKQVLKALEHITANHEKLRINPNKIFLAGDSAGSQISSQIAAMITNPSYSQKVGLSTTVEAKQLAGLVLYCGPYNPELLKQSGSDPAFSWFIDTVLWAYTGTKDYAEILEIAAPYNHLTEDFPASFISVGNNDPLKQHSYQLAAKLEGLGVRVETLFFEGSDTHALPHEYQFKLLEFPAAEQALEESIAFMRSVLNNSN